MNPVVMYKAVSWSFGKIHRVEADKVSELEVWIDGERWPKQSPTSRIAYFETWEEAHKYLLDNAREDLTMRRKKAMIVQRDVEIAQERVMTIQGMRKP